jgi:hypothetical protein
VLPSPVKAGNVVTSRLGMAGRSGSASPGKQQQSSPQRQQGRGQQRQASPQKQEQRQQQLLQTPKKGGGWDRLWSMDYTFESGSGGK